MFGIFSISDLPRTIIRTTSGAPVAAVYTQTELTRNQTRQKDITCRRPNPCAPLRRRLQEEIGNRNEVNNSNSAEPLDQNQGNGKGSKRTRAGITSPERSARDLDASRSHPNRPIHRSAASPLRERQQRRGVEGLEGKPCDKAMGEGE